MKKFMAILVVLLLAAVSFAEEGFTVSEITPEIFARIQGKSYKDNCPIPRLQRSHSF